MKVAVLVAEIGSTTTVVNAFDGIGGPCPRFLGQGQAFTSVLGGDVTVGLRGAVEDLRRHLGVSEISWGEMFATSSAAGGLRMSVHGLVYDMTVRAAKEAALGAGGILKHVTAGKMRRTDLKKIVEIRPNIVLVAGFQGVDATGAITTIGRGGSDTTAVALAVALKADECQILTDVDGVYTTDPRMVPEARRLDRITFEEMLELASQGSKVLQIRSVEFAGKYKVPLRVLSSFTPWDIDIVEEAQSGTLITFEEDEHMEQAIVSGIAFNRDEAKISVLGVPG